MNTDLNKEIEKVDTKDKPYVHKSDLEPVYRYFLYFEIITIICFIPIMGVQFGVAFDFFNYINNQVNLYHYYFVTQRIIPTFYLADLVVKAKNNPYTYADTFKHNCPSGYSYNNFLRLTEIYNATAEDITKKLVLDDPDYNTIVFNPITGKNETTNTPIKLDPVARNMKFWKFDISKVNLDPTTHTYIELVTGWNFVEWKGKRYCKKVINIDHAFKLLQIIEGTKSCTTEFKSYIADDCGSYYNNTYRICALRDFAISNKGVSYADDNKLLTGSDKTQNNNICPITNLEILNKTNPQNIKLTSTIKNLPNKITGKPDDRFQMIFTEMVTFQNPYSKPDGNYLMTNYKEGTSLILTNDYTFGMTDYNSIQVDTDSFMRFVNYTTSAQIYYKNFLNSTSGVDFYMPYDSKGTVKAVLSLNVIKSIPISCFQGVYLKENTSDLFGPKASLNVTSFFSMSLTILIWTIASIFLGSYAMGNIRLRIIHMKLNGSLNSNNKEAEEITKWTIIMFWFIIVMVKMLVVCVMLTKVNYQIYLAQLMIDQQCYSDDVVGIFTIFIVFLTQCKEKLMSLLWFLVLVIFLSWFFL